MITRIGTADLEAQTAALHPNRPGRSSPPFCGSYENPAVLLDNERAFLQPWHDNDT